MKPRTNGETALVHLTGQTRASAGDGASSLQRESSLWQRLQRELRRSAGRLTEPIRQLAREHLAPENLERLQTLERITSHPIDALFAEATPQVRGHTVVWWTPKGPRLHPLKLPRSKLGRNAWRHARPPSLQGALGARLSTTSLGDPELLRWLAAEVDESGVETDNRELGAEELIVVSAKQLAGQPGGRETVGSVMEACGRSGARPLLWVEEQVDAAAVNGLYQGFDGLVVIAASPASRHQLTRQGASRPVSCLGPVASTEPAALPTAAPGTLWLGELGANAEAGWREALEAAGSQRNLRALPGFAPLPRADDGAAAGSGASFADDALEVLLVSGDGNLATSEQLTGLARGLALGLPVFATREADHSLQGAFSQLPRLMVDDAAALVRQLSALTLTPQALERRGQLTRRFARTHLSQDARLARFAACTGLPFLGKRARRVSVLCVSRRPELALRCLETYRSQTYPHKELIFVANADTLSDSEVEAFIAERADVCVLRTDSDHSLGESLNRARRMASGELWTKLDDDDYYAPEYLRDLVQALETSGAQIAGKGSFFCYLEDSQQLLLHSGAPENGFTDRFIHGGTILAERRAVEHIDFRPVTRGTDTLFLQESKLQGLKIFSADRFNFTYFRYSKPGHHTFSVEDEQFLRKCQLVQRGFDADVVSV